MNCVAKLLDVKVKIRFSLVRQKTRMGFLPGGALLKLACGETEIEAKAGAVLQVPLTLNRAKGLTEPASVELLLGETSEGITAKPMTIDGQTGKFVFPVSLPTVDVQPEYKVTVRATVQKNGDLPTVSQTSVIALVSESFPLPAGVQD